MINRRLVLGGALAAMTMGAAKAVEHEASSLMLTDGRRVPLDIWRPGGASRGLVAFSHGANSRPDKYSRLCSVLAVAGFTVVAPLHADSPDHPGGGSISREQGVPMRMTDMGAVFGEFAVSGQPMVAAGHSYGGLIAQMLGGAAGTPASDIKAVLAFSPPGPFPPAITTDTWKSMARPMYVQTGTADVLPMMAPKWDVHRTSHDASPAPSVLFVGQGVDHYFGNIIGRPERNEAPQTAQFGDAMMVALGFIERMLTGRTIADLARPPYTGQSWVEVRR
nr:alpha/beta hydrolase [Polymorphobacter sp.]